MTSTVPTCPLCDTNLQPILRESRHWRLVLNRNQTLLGKCFLVLRRHLETVTQVDSDEWSELQAEMAMASETLRRVFQPDHFNFAFLQNQDRHVHLHIIPRYAESRVFGDLTFKDANYPDHYAVPAPVRLLPTPVSLALAEALRRHTIT